MRKLIMWNVITLDGYFEGERPWDLSFHELIWNKEVEQFGMEQLESADMLVFGKATYEGMAAHWQAAKGEDAQTAKYMNSIKKIVCSPHLEKADWDNTSIVRDAVKEIPDIKKQGSGDMYVFGSGKLSANLMQADLFDEYRLLIAPVFLGKGRRLFNDGLPYQQLELLEARPLLTGGVILRYGVKRELLKGFSLA